MIAFRILQQNLLDSDYRFGKYHGKKLTPKNDRIDDVVLNFGR